MFKDTLVPLGELLVWFASFSAEEDNARDPTDTHLIQHEVTVPPGRFEDELDRSHEKKVQDDQEGAEDDGQCWDNGDCCTP